jgi:hypothetical protein
MDDNYSAMKAFIIYENIASALRVVNALWSVAHRRDIRVDWKINLWRANMLRFGTVADEALREAVDAELVVLTGAGAISLRPWLDEWQEGWSRRRLTGNAALALVQDKPSAGCSTIRTSELSEFAKNHHLRFITNDCEVRNATAPTSLAFGVNQSQNKSERPAAHRSAPRSFAKRSTCTGRSLNEFPLPDGNEGHIFHCI